MDVFDYHIHSDISADGKATIEQMCMAATKLGVRDICFTEHIDIGDPRAAERFTIHDPQGYVDRIRRAKERFPGLAVRLGVELASTKDSAPAEKQLLSGLQLDFILVSCHLSGGIDPAWPNCYAGRERDDVVTGYFLAVHEAVHAHDSFDSLAHIGYVYRYLTRYRMYRPDQRAYLPGDAPDILDGILRRVVGLGAAIEINTSTYDEYGFCMPVPYIIKRYAALGGEAATFASDAHRPEHIAQHYDLAMDILKQCGIRYLASFDARARTLHKI